MRDKCFASAPTLGLMHIWLSFSMTVRSVAECPASFSASNANPPVREPSPMIAATLKPSAKISRDLAMPNAADMEVLLCPVSKQSCSLSFRFGKPLIPPNCLKE